MADIRKKEDVEFHGEGYAGDGMPAVNVKVYKGFDDVKLPICLGGSRPADQPDAPITWSYTDAAFTVEWVEENLTEKDINGWWDVSLENGWEYLQGEAEDIWGAKVKVYSEGRSGGWAIVHGIPAFESWDAIELNKWKRFATACRAQADDIPHAMLVSIYMNVYEPMLEAKEAGMTRVTVELNDGTVVGDIVIENPGGEALQAAATAYDALRSHSRFIVDEHTFTCREAEEWWA